MIRALILAVDLVISTIIAFLLLLIFGLINPYSRICGGIFYVWSWLIIKISGIRIDVSGLDNIDPSIGYIVASNHLHLYDIPVIAAASGLNIRFAAKKELFKIPIFGQALYLCGMVRIDRGNTQSALQTLRKTESIMKTHQVSVVLFPEGTRNRDGAGMLPFKKGAFMMALNTGLPMLPITINRTDSRLQGFSIKPGTVTMHIHPPMDPADYSLDTRQAFMNDLRATISAKLERP